MKKLQNKTAIVTGSTSGIGLEIAKHLAANGSNVILNGLGKEKLVSDIVERIKSAHNVDVIYSSCDVSDTEQVRDLVKTGLSVTGNIDILVNNAGVQYVSAIQGFPIEEWDKIISINLSSAFKAIKFALPHMIKNNFGRIINIASAHGLVASPFKSAYVASKHGIIGLTKSVALEIAEKNITCNAICPGYVKTPLVEKQIIEQAKVHDISEERVIKEVLLKAQPNKRFIEAADLAEMSVFISSDSGKGMNGQVISMDGGWTAA